MIKMKGKVILFNITYCVHNLQQRILEYSEISTEFQEVLHHLETQQHRAHQDEEFLSESLLARLYLYYQGHLEFLRYHHVHGHLPFKLEGIRISILNFIHEFTIE